MFYNGTKGITLALRGNNTAIKKPSRVDQGSSELHWDRPSASSPRSRGMSFSTPQEPEAPWRAGGKQSSHLNSLNKSWWPDNLQNALKAKAFIAIIHYSCFSNTLIEHLMPPQLSQPKQTLTHRVLQEQLSLCFWKISCWIPVYQDGFCEESNPGLHCCQNFTHL